ncbi:transcriptional regulator [Phyllobacterium phragmitis]|uniref:Transcriptional regulator n=2 Tax=Phyllobacterium phragmitis TaxID=2670329 RepID=A0A2S9IMY4_9HYPH|nr:transcriptional regulator [Phyllobacterium phragmitis]
MSRIDIHNSDTPVLCQSCEIRHKGMCGVLDPKQLLALSKHTRITRHDRGEQLSTEDTPITAYANVMRGVVKLTKMLEDGRQQVVGLQFAPDFMGRLFGQDNQITAEAASDVELCKVPRAALEKLIAEYPQLEHRLMQQVLRELDEARDWMMTLGRKSAAEKVASFLYLIATHTDPQAHQANTKSAEFDLPLTRADIGDFLGLTIETVSRQMTKLRIAGVIAIVASRHITVPDLERLKSRCG